MQNVLEYTDNMEMGPVRAVSTLTSGARRLIAASALLGLLLVAPAALAHGYRLGTTSAANPSLDVTFTAAGTIAVTLADGTTPVGSATGTPTVIPAGYYTVLLAGPGGCTELPTFRLKGPGDAIVSNLQDGEVTSTGFNAYFQPNATYTWSNDAAPSVVYTFTTSGDVVGAPPSPTSAGSSKPSAATSTMQSTQDVVGSALTPFRGTLSGSVGATGTLTLAFKGKSVTKLMPGRYTIAVTDKSAKNGFMLAKAKQAALSVTSVAFIGKRSLSIDLTAGRWFVSPKAAGKQTYAVVVG